jgi:hypothetical protein
LSGRLPGQRTGSGDGSDGRQILRDDERRRPAVLIAHAHTVPQRPSDAAICELRQRQVVDDEAITRFGVFGVDGDDDLAANSKRVRLRRRRPPARVRDAEDLGSLHGLRRLGAARLRNGERDFDSIPDLARLDGRGGQRAARRGRFKGAGLPASRPDRGDREDQRHSLHENLRETAV